MTQKEFIQALTVNDKLDLVVDIKDTVDVNITAKFIALTFDSSNSNVTMKVEVTTTNKGIILNNGNITEMMPSITTTRLLRADENTQIAVIDENDVAILDTAGDPLTIPENIYWKYLAWDNALFAPFKVLIEAAIKIKFNLIPNNTTLKVTKADYGL